MSKRLLPLLLGITIASIGSGVPMFQDGDPPKTDQKNRKKRKKIRNIQKASRKINRRK